MDTTASCGQAVILTDDTQLQHRLEEQLSGHGFQVLSITNVRDVSRLDLARPPALAILDLDGSCPADEALEVCQRLGSRAVVSLVSPSSMPRLSTLAGQAAVLLRKPFAPEELEFLLAGMESPQRPPSRMDGEGGLVGIGRSGEGHGGSLHGASPQIQGVRKLAHQVASSDTHVTITGEAGVGKRRVGRLIHACGPRAGGAFLQVGCAGFSARLLETLIFGSGSSPGCLEEGRTGTLLIDDIDVMPLSLQEQLFGYLSAGTDGSGARGQVIAVSSRNLEAQVRAGAFHEGLFELASSAQIEVPPLRERKADIPILADRFTRSFHGGQRRIEPAVVAELMRYEWPGNVRELRDILEHAMEGSSASVLSVQDLPSLPESAVRRGDVPQVPGATIHEIERDAILRTLDAMGGSTSKTARVLQMSVRKIQYKLKEYRTEAPSLAATMTATMTATMAATESRPSVAERRNPTRKSHVAASSK